MTDMHIKQFNGYWQLLLICMLGLIVSACSNFEASSGVDENGSGTINLQLVWQNAANEIEAIDPPSGDVCVDFQIETVNVQVINGSGPVASQQWSCNEHGGDMTEIPAGSGYQVVVDGLIGSEVHWQGMSDSPISVLAGQISDPVTVAMDYVGNDETPPTATTSPADLAANVATDTVISIVFSEAVVAASLTGASIIVSDGAANVTGTLDYNADTYTLTFQPSQDLAVSTTYTITVTTDVMDVSGHNLAQNVTNNFTTTRVWYVDGGAAPGGNGQSWSDPFDTITAAITAASDDEQVWVKAGTYLLSRQNVAIQILVNKAVEILGGFAGTETQHHQRDWENLATIVDGEESYRCFFLAADATLDGFTITRGTLVGSLPGGAGMYIDAAAPNIVNCTFYDNNIGGSGGEGAAIHIANGNPVITNCTFEENSVVATSTYGGAIYNDQGGPTISGCIFRNNRSSNGFGNSGGAIRNQVAQATTTISNCIFDSNSTFGESSTGGAIYNYDSNISILNCRFDNNSSGGIDSYGGAIYNLSSDVLIQNSVFNNNSASSLDMGRGGAIYNYSSSPTITNCTFASNEAYSAGTTNADGGAIANYSASNPIITNCILWDNEAQNGSQIYDDTGSSATVTYCNIDQSGYTTGGNLSKHPRFGASYHLRADSPCVDQGNTASATAIDIDSESRPQSSAADMGADEFRDSDGDKIPDYWEMVHGLSISTNDSDTDSDGDLLPALSEYQVDTDPNSAETILNATDRGAWSSGGDHTATDKSTPTGSESGTYRSFFIFDLSSLSATIGAAAVRLELTAYTSISPEETLQIYDVSTPAAALTADGPDAGIYDDLGSGELFGEFEARPADQNTVLDIQLNTEAVAGINAAAGGYFAIGLRLETLVGNGALFFSNANEDRTHQLILVAE